MRLASNLLICPAHTPCCAPTLTLWLAIVVMHTLHWALKAVTFSLGDSRACLQEEQELRTAAEKQLGSARECIAQLQRALGLAQKQVAKRCGWWPVTGPP